ncbi:MAG: aminoglycoside phosphotransferase, partial [Gammaproteobacteria bacterium]|nr:aminoglycoside phosphotransferase [Gammaproteobacteria bacterium]
MAPDSNPGSDGTARLRGIVERLAGQTGAEPQILETHISIVLLAGDQAWKFKKPVSLGFLDFSTLELRRHYCERELALNSRYAPAVYQRVAAIGGSVDAPVIDATGPAIEYAVVMRRFDDAARLDVLLERGKLECGDFAALGQSIGRLYGEAERAP